MRDAPVLRRSADDGVWSIVAPRRSRKPYSLGARQGNDGRVCDFCPGNEDKTEREVFAVRRDGSWPDSAGWIVRVVPNKYPALDSHSQTRARRAGQYREVAAQGYHEIIVESPDHDKRFGTFRPEELATLFEVYRSRLDSLSKRRPIKSVALFRNEGAAAGASQEHPHAQVLALPVVSARVATEVEGAVRHLRRHGCCATCAMLDTELEDENRLVVQNSDFGVLTAFAPRFPYELWVVPKAHVHDFGQSTERQLAGLAGILRQVLSILDRVLGPFPFNVVVQTAPVGARGTVERAYHWRLELLPRLSSLSGFEIGSGMFIVDTAPEEAARTMRAAARVLEQSIAYFPENQAGSGPVTPQARYGGLA